jgi:hypothetical protein
MIYLPSLGHNTASLRGPIQLPNATLQCRIQHFLLVPGISVTPGYEFVLCLRRKKFQCLRQNVERFLAGGRGKRAFGLIHNNATIRRIDRMGAIIK